MTDLVIDFNNHDSKTTLWENLRPLTGEYCIRIERKKKRRSYNQNKYYWGVVVAYLSDFTGHSDMEIHVWLKHIFLPHVVADEVGMWSTSDLNTIEFEEFLELVRMTVFVTFGTKIPLPNEVILK